MGRKDYDIYFGLRDLSKSCKDIKVSRVTDLDGWLTVTASHYSFRFLTLVKPESLFDSKFTEVNIYITGPDIIEFLFV
jgi:hypothetical protein